VREGILTLLPPDSNEANRIASNTRDLSITFSVFLQEAFAVMKERKGEEEEEETDEELEEEEEEEEGESEETERETDGNTHPLTEDRRDVVDLQRDIYSVLQRIVIAIRTVVGVLPPIYQSNMKVFFFFFLFFSFFFFLCFFFCFCFFVFFFCCFCFFLLFFFLFFFLLFFFYFFIFIFFFFFFLFSFFFFSFLFLKKSHNHNR
jgi:hypothetical protein